MSTATNPSTSGTAAIGNLPDPVHSNVKVTHSLDKLALNAPLWENDVISVLVSKNVFIYVEEEHSGTKGDAVAKGVLTEKILGLWRPLPSLMPSRCGIGSGQNTQMGQIRC